MGYNVNMFTDKSYADKFRVKARIPDKDVSYRKYIVKDEKVGIINFGFDCPYCKSYNEGWSASLPIGCGICSYIFYGKEEPQRSSVKQISLL